MNAQKIIPFLMFDGKAEEALNFYTSLFKQAEILSITRYETKEAGKKGTVQQAAFSINGLEFMCIDSSIMYDFTFTPSFSLYVNCDSDDEIEFLFKKLSENGRVFMQLAPYPFSERYGWTADKYGVSWQLNLSKGQ